MLFEDLGLVPEIARAVAEQGYTQPTPIQQQAIPVVMRGGDVMAAAQTGTGKTAGFTLPLLHRLSAGPRARNNQVRALVLTPTRELAAQVFDNVQSYSEHLPMRHSVVFGGVKINPQMMRLRGGADILVATPGRLLDLYNQRAIKFDRLETLVLDEADRMLDMGFIHDIKKILRVLPEKRQNLLFSATFSPEIRSLAKGLVNDPVEIDVAPRNSTTKTVRQKLHPVDKSRKASLLCHLIKENDWHQALVFSRTKHGANRLAKQLEQHRIPAAAIHGNKSQNARTKALADFKNGKVQILVATDIAARGIDIDQLPQVVNFDLPNVPEDYVHRIGRTGRAGASGHAVSLVSADEIKQLRDIERLIQKPIEREEIEGFEPDHVVPESGGKIGKGSQVRRGGAGRSKPGNGKAGGNKPSGNKSGGNKPSGNRSASGNRANGNRSEGRNGNERNGNGRSGNSRSGNRAANGNSNGNTAAKPGQRRRRPQRRTESA
ncbi:DEAD/DEAH box helicase [Microbulbifer agarilyticus]|uniref:DEAD/DEAH box helicase n=1 Tax=Microbulbifer agarilyticus TaxID=260552 RepID=UPI001C984323|nr:DEAD/DEAH box helicase [Microbulbifer agarilyticus]MBY6210228.1 DEAD/DEAH box helicase [Microbulbifer agarilyticus]MCA0892719.1 DEAD/DEAH box helicase [Microbulbifer agarilyticus]